MPLSERLRLSDNLRMAKEFQQLDWNELIEDDLRQLVRLAVREDLDRQYDWTTVALVEPRPQGRAAVVVRQAGVMAGLRAMPIVIDEMQPRSIASRAPPTATKLRPARSSPNFPAPPATCSPASGRS